MTDVDISLLTRLTPAALAADPELQAQVAPILRAADSDGQPNAEDRVFTEAEITAYISRLRQAHQQTHALFNRQRSHLAGSLSSAQERVRGEEGGETLASLLQAAAANDAFDSEGRPRTADAEGNPLSEDDLRRMATELSAEDLEALARHMDDMEREGAALNAPGVIRSVESLVESARGSEQLSPEAFLPEDPAAQRADIDLNFLRHLPSSVFTATDDDSRVVQNLLHVAGVDPSQTEGDWRLSYSELETWLATQPEEHRGSPERVMADFRFIAFQLREATNQAIAEAGPDVPGLDGVRLSLQPLIDRRPLINDPAVDQVLELAGDATLTTIELERLLQLEENRNPGFLRGLLEGAPAGTEGQSDLQRATAFYLSEVRSLIDRYNREVAALNPTVAADAVDPDLALSRHVLTALENMRSGFTHRDREYAERNALVGLIDMISYVCTLGGALTWIGAGSPAQLNPAEAAEYGADWPRFGPTYRHLVRESVASHDSERGAALAALRQIIEHPPADFSGARTIPNALDYLRDHDDTERVASGRGLHAAAVPGSVVPGTGRHRRYHDLLTGDFFQARRLWEIHRETDLHRQTQMWFDLAQNLRSGEAGGFWADGTHADGVRNTDYARAILHALRRQSTESSMRRRATVAFADSMGHDILDENGHVVTEGGGEFGLQPWLWFRNYSDESADAVASDVVALGASIYIGGGVTGAGRSLLTSAGRQSLSAGALRFFGMRATQTVATEAALGTAIEGSTAGMGIFGRAMSRLGGPAWASRLVASREAALRAAVAAGNETEIRAATAALARARDLQGILTAPTLGSGVEAAAPRLTGWAGRVVNAHPPVPASWAQAATGTGLRAFAARGGSAVLENLQLASIGRGFNWFMNSGIFIYGISSQVFGQLRTRVDQENLQDFDMSYDLLLAARPAPPPAAEADRPADVNSRDGGSGDDVSDADATEDALEWFVPPSSGD